MYSGTHLWCRVLRFLPYVLSMQPECLWSLCVYSTHRRMKPHPEACQHSGGVEAEGLRGQTDTPAAWSSLCPAVLGHGGVGGNQPWPCDATLTPRPAHHTHWAQWQKLHDLTMKAFLYIDYSCSFWLAFIMRERFCPVFEVFADFSVSSTRIQRTLPG